MKKDLLSVALAYLLGVVALSFAGIVYTIGGSFAVWSPGHDVGYFINIHAGLLEKAGMAASTRPGRGRTRASAGHRGILADG